MKALPDGYLYVANNGWAVADCNGTHIGPDDGTRGTLCGRIHGGEQRIAPATERDVCGSCRRVLASRIRKAAGGPLLRRIEAGKYEVAGAPYLRIMNFDGWWEGFEVVNQGHGDEWVPLAGVPKRTMREALASYLPDGARSRRSFKSRSIGADDGE